MERLEVRATPTTGLLFANMHAEIMESAPVTNAAAGHFLGLLSADGHFRDLDYRGNSDKSAADLQSHGNRLEILAQAYKWDDPSNVHFGDPALRSQIIQGWSYAANKAGRVRAPNWWWGAIGVPQGMSDGLVLMRDEMSASLRNSILSKYFSSVWNPGKYDGANLTYQAPMAMIDAMFRGNHNRIRDIVTRVSKELSAYSGEGIQRDLSFFQHKVGGKLNWHSGSYGLVFTRDTARIMRWADDTDFAFGQPAVDQHVRYVLDHLQWLTRGHVFEITSQGRSITRPRQITNATAVLHDAIVDMLPLGRRTDEMLAYLDRYANGPTEDNHLSGNKQLWKADTLLHHRQDWMASVRMLSSRTVRPETAAGENTKGFFEGDGFTMLVHEGDEFGRRGEQEIVPVWDWQRLPGTTVEQNGKIPYTNMFGGSTNVTAKSSLVGSASTGEYGVAAMDYARTGVNVTARKAWFMFDDELIALGANIDAPKATAPVFTSLNQVLLDGPVTVEDAAGVRQSFDLGGSAVLDSGSWIHHAGIGYVMLDGASQTTVQARMQSGSGVSLPVFSAWVDHGLKPVNATYAYAVVPGVTPDELDGYAGNLPFRTLANDANIQAVQHLGLGQTQIAFYAPGKLWLDDQTWVSVDRPAMMVVRDLGDALEITVSDQTQKAKSLTVETNRRLIGSGAKWSGGDQMTRISFTLPVGAYAGSSTTKTFATQVNALPLDTAAADAYVRNGSYASTNYGEAPTLYVQNYTTGNTRDAFLRFDLSNVQGEIVFAEVRLMAIEARRTTTIAIAEAGNDTWQEEHVIWNTKPGTGPEIARASASQGNWTSFDVTEQANQAANGDGQLSLRVYAPSRSSYFVGLASSEHPNVLYRPVLEIFTRQPSTGGEDVPNPPAESDPTDPPIGEGPLPPTDPPPSNPPITEPNPAPHLITESIALPAAGDVYVYAGATLQNFGDATTLLVRNHTSTNSAKALLRFDPTGIEGEIVSATIKLQVVNASGPMALALSHAGNDTWHESYVRWSTKPAERAEIARTIANQGQSIAFDATNLTREAAASAARLSLWVHAPTISSDFVELASREHPSEAYRPVLEIVVRRPAPAPASAPLEPEGEGPVALDAGLLALVVPTASRPLSLSDYLAVRRLTDDLPAQTLFGPLPPTDAPASSLPAADRRSWSIAEAGDLVYRGRSLTAAQLLPAAIDAALGGYADPESDLLDPEASAAAE